LYYNLRDVGLHLAAFLNFLLGIFVLCKNTRSSRHISLFLLSCSVGLWTLEVDYFLLTPSIKLAYFWIHAVAVTISLISISFYHLVLTFQYEKISLYKNKLLLAYSLPIAILVGSFIPHFYIKDIIVHPWGKENILGIGFYMVYFIYGFYMVFAFINLLISFKISVGRKKNQIKYIIYSTIFAAIWGTFFNWILVLFGNYRYIWVGPYGTFVLVASIFYSIVKHRLLDIDTVIHKTILWLLTILILIIPVGLIHGLLRIGMAKLPLIWVITIDTLILIAFLFYYHRLKPKIDHFFRRRKYDYYAVLAEIGQKIGSELDIDSVVNRLFKELKDVLYIRNGLVLVQQSGQLDYEEIGNVGYERISNDRKADKALVTYQSTLGQWVNINQRIVEKEQVEIDPQYESIKQEVLYFMNQNSLEVTIPVVLENKVNALVGIGKKDNLQAYTLKDIELLEHLGKQIGITIDNALHHEDIVEKERLAEELRLGREIQMALLPQETPTIPGLTVYGLMQPAKEIGGDYYDFITLTKQNSLAIVIGDVSGKGVAAGLLMAMAKTAIHTISQEEPSPRQVLIKTNQILYKHLGSQKFMTMLYLSWNAQTRTLSYSSAGHEHILVYRADTKKVESILSGGFMLGMMPDIEHFLEDNNLDFNPRDKIILYTDGVTEAHDAENNFFGLEKLISIIEKSGQSASDELLNIIKQELYGFIGSREQYDDITVVVIEREA